jgi:hypothetical protein
MEDSQKIDSKEPEKNNEELAPEEQDKVAGAGWIDVKSFQRGS